MMRQQRTPRRGASAWAPLVGEVLGSRIAAASVLARALVVVTAVMAASAVGIAILGVPLDMTSGFGWVLLLLALAVAYASPLALLRGSRIREQLRTRLTDAGLRFETTPPVATVAGFERWLERNHLDRDDVRSALTHPEM
ncbi:hypothetical protein KNO15_14790 [Leifsonia shinshuensis]|uniref:hypothetical protein n=1 Tax=Leifsonia shinshuensis TaxID=150026 RepID=UPI001F51127D|nr:hypothetical protein [Leifsonia shinshuensis]MCI0157964.1 hypothetical protein [Leifsonia shinshuensis]